MTDAGTVGEGADLTPRPARPRRRGARRLVPWIVTIAVVAAVAALVLTLLGDAALFFYNADEAVERRTELGDDRFRIQGTPVDNSVVETFRGDEPVVVFSIVFDDVAVDVVHVGDPPELFQPGVPVVLEGAWVESEAPAETFDGLADDGWHFASDRMLVKHDNDYRNRDDYEQRTDEAEQGGLDPAGG